MLEFVYVSDRFLINSNLAMSMQIVKGGWLDIGVAKRFFQPPMWARVIHADREEILPIVKFDKNEPNTREEDTTCKLTVGDGMQTVDFLVQYQKGPFTVVTNITGAVMVWIGSEEALRQESLAGDDWKYRPSAMPEYCGSKTVFDALALANEEVKVYRQPNLDCYRIVFTDRHRPIEHFPPPGYMQMSGERLLAKAIIFFLSIGKGTNLVIGPDGQRVQYGQGRGVLRVSRQGVFLFTLRMIQEDFNGDDAVDLIGLMGFTPPTVEDSVGVISGIQRAGVAVIDSQMEVEMLIDTEQGMIKGFSFMWSAQGGFRFTNGPPQWVEIESDLTLRRVAKDSIRRVASRSSSSSTDTTPDFLATAMDYFTSINLMTQRNAPDILRPRKQVMHPLSYLMTGSVAPRRPITNTETNQLTNEWIAQAENKKRIEDRRAQLGAIRWAARNARLRQSLESLNPHLKITWEPFFTPRQINKRQMTNEAVVEGNRRPGPPSSSLSSSSSSSSNDPFPLL
jgi:hypothetical protein